MLGAGAVYVFERVGITWAHQAYVKASNTEPDDHFGFSVALSADGNELVVGAADEDSSAVLVGGDESDNSAPNSGAVYVFARNSSVWTQQGYLKARNTNANDGFGRSVALNMETLVVGAPFEQSASRGTDGAAGDNSATSAGAVYVFVKNGSSWQDEAYVKASNTDAGDRFGESVALTEDILAVGAFGEEGAVVGGDDGDNSAPAAGAVYVLVRNGENWQQQAYVKASNTDANDRFGESIALSGDTLAVGARLERSLATGVGGDEGDNSASGAGAVYVYQ